MKNPLLDSPRSKIDRAIQHLKQLDEAIGQLWAAESKSVSSGRAAHKMEGETIVLFRPNSAPVDPSLSLALGDFIHNVRSSLDHLVYQLAVLNSASSEAATKTSFPVCLTRGEFKNATRKKVAPFLSATALAEIEKLQPYSTGEGERDRLWVLSQLDIIDKHRLLIVTKCKVRPINLTVTTLDNKEFFHEFSDTDLGWKASEAGTELLRFDISITGEVPPGKVKVKVGTAMTVQIEQTGLACDGMILQAVLEDCIRYTVGVIDRFGGKFFSE